MWDGPIGIDVTDHVDLSGGAMGNGPNDWDEACTSVYLVHTYIHTHRHAHTHTDTHTHT